jgi:DNA-binding winged helix-turn-helix (wHTH) protein/TolB-like protein
MKTSTSADGSPPLYEFGEFRLVPSQRQLLRSGEAVHLTPRVFDTLLFLVEHRGRVLTKDELLAAVWPGVIVEDNNLGQAISKLRQAFGEAPGDKRFIATVPGRGYRFVAEVAEVAAGEAESRAAARLPLVDEEPSSRHRLTPWQLAAATALLVAGIVAAALLWSPGPVPDAPSGPPRLLAVLPFKPLVADDPDPALELGLADSLIVKLGSVGALSVRPLAAVRRFQDPATDPVAAGRELRVDAVLDGHLQRVDDRIRVSARLLRVADGQQLWADEFDEQLTGIFAIQQTISKRIVDALALQLDERARHRLARQSTTSAAAYERYLRGRFHLSLAQPRQAIEMFEAAIALDPDYASAHAGLADILSRVPIATDTPSKEPMARARALAARALALDPELGSAYAVLGWIGFYHDWDWPGSEANYLRALALDAEDFSARLGYAHLLSNTGRTTEAIAQVDLALQADPLSVLAGTLKGQFLFHGGRLRESREQLEATMRHSPGFWIAQVVLGQLHLQEGRLHEAVAAFEQAAASGGNSMPKGLAAYAHARGGNDLWAREILDALQRANNPPVPPYVVAMVHLGLGEKAAALAALERGYGGRDVWMAFIGVDPIWRPLHDDPDFADLLQRMNLTPAGTAPGARR